MTNRLYIALPCIDARAPHKRGVLVRWTRCGKFGVVKYRGEKARLVLRGELRRVYGECWERVA